MTVKTLDISCLWTISLLLLLYLRIWTLNCGLVFPNHKGMPSQWTKDTRNDMGWHTSQNQWPLDCNGMQWLKEVHTLTCTNHQQTSKDGHGKAIKPTSAKSYNMHMGYVNRGGWIENNYLMNWHTIHCLTCPFWIGGPYFHFVVLRFHREVSETTWWETLYNKQHFWDKFTLYIKEDQSIQQPKYIAFHWGTINGW